MVNSLLDRRFHALAHPVRRGIVERLGAGPCSVGDATAGLGASKPAISKHLKVLENADLVSRTVDGRVHQLTLRRDALAITADWIDRQRALWERAFDVVGDYLTEQGHLHPEEER